MILSSLRVSSNTFSYPCTYVSWTMTTFKQKQNCSSSIFFLSSKYVYFIDIISIFELFFFLRVSFENGEKKEDHAHVNIIIVRNNFSIYNEYNTQLTIRSNKKEVWFWIYNKNSQYLSIFLFLSYVIAIVFQGFNAINFVACAWRHSALQNTEKVLESKPSIALTKSNNAMLYVRHRSFRSAQLFDLFFQCTFMPLSLPFFFLSDQHFFFFFFFCISDRRDWSWFLLMRGDIYDTNWRS